MVAVISNNVAGSYVTGVPTNSLGDVLVVAEQKVDSLLMCDLLLRAGYRTSLCDDIAALAAGTSEHMGDQYYASVICHRDINSGALSSALVSNVPGARVLVVSDSIAEQTVVSILENGAHHVFNLRESRSLLQVRLEAALYQHGRLSRKSFMHGDIHFDVQKRRVSRAGKPVDLSPKEYDLACYLFSNRERVVGNSELMTSVWSLPPDMDTRRIDTAACRVRKKLRLVEQHGWELKRIRRVGYRLIRLDRSDVTSAPTNNSAKELEAVAS
jgi:two-component system response regulator RegX3